MAHYILILGLRYGSLQFSVPVMVGSAACGHQGCCEQQDQDGQKAGPGPGVPSGASRLWTTCSRLTQGADLSGWPSQTTVAQSTAEGFKSSQPFTGCATIETALKKRGQMQPPLPLVGEAIEQKGMRAGTWHVKPIVPASAALGTEAPVLPGGSRSRRGERGRGTGTWPWRLPLPAAALVGPGARTGLAGFRCDSSSVSSHQVLALAV
ncbi:unnamed protein product [Rangifer tarandus platyrhynchus]|uniref:Uncharacterized protein n=2 Tax=Rangifer tarandus platyrhynchus TaxID=3082113 RepID=A0ABN9A7B9_RANTA|nr:unnamed protein product [Rangifer tarandus platyrhynchus]CAI9714244.1 unnamed protein product [Rangifer tarandus platyrhynchus]